MLRLFKLEPALVVGVVQAAIALAVGLGLHLTPERTGVLLACTTALLALITAITAHPFRVSALTAALAGLGTALAAFGIPHITSGTVAELNLLVAAVAAFFLRVHLTTKLRPEVPAPAPAKM